MPKIFDNIEADLLSALQHTLNRQLRTGIPDEKLAELVIALREEDRLCIVHEEERSQEPRLICSLGLVPKEEAVPCN